MDNWIDVKSRLPDDDGLYLIRGTTGGPLRAIYEKATNKWQLDSAVGFRDPDVKYWMPIPLGVQGKSKRA